MERDKIQVVQESYRKRVVKQAVKTKYKQTVDCRLPPAHREWRFGF